MCVLKGTLSFSIWKPLTQYVLGAVFSTLEKKKKSHPVDLPVPTKGIYWLSGGKGNDRNSNAIHYFTSKNCHSIFNTDLQDWLYWPMYKLHQVTTLALAWNSAAHLYLLTTVQNRLFFPGKLLVNCNNLYANTTQGKERRGTQKWSCWYDNSNSSTQKIADIRRYKTLRTTTEDGNWARLGICCSKKQYIPTWLSDCLVSRDSSGARTSL